MRLEARLAALISAKTRSPVIRVTASWTIAAPTPLPRCSGATVHDIRQTRSKRSRVPTAPPKIVLTCRAHRIGPTKETIFIYSPRNAGLRLDDQFVGLMAATTKDAAQRAFDLGNQFEQNEACDHLFFESAVIAQAVRARGGKVFLWPHSSNAGHPLMYAKGDVAAVRCTTNSSARVWSARLPGTPCAVQSNLILQPCSAPRPSTPGAPLTVVIFASVHVLRRMPFVDRRGHEDSYRRLLKARTDLAPQVRALFKPRWKSTEWLRGVVGPSAVFEETTRTPLELDEPNMIFVTVSYGSTALLEGLGRGIPCISSSPACSFSIFPSGRESWRKRRVSPAPAAW